MSASVAEQILAKLRGRLAAINGISPFHFDATNRIMACRPSLDVLAEQLSTCEIIFFVFRQLGGERRTGNKPTELHVDITVTYTVAAVVRRTGEAGVALEKALADIERAIELRDDPFLSVNPAVSKKPGLLSQELTLAPSTFELPEDGIDFEALAIGVQCTFPHVYGDPSKIA